MTARAQILLEGSYFYFEGETNYSQENFRLIEAPDHGLTVLAEILSRIETGDFLKILVHYELNPAHAPVLVRIEKHLGSQYAQELYRIDREASELHYTFTSPNQTQEFRSSINTRHSIATPAFATSCIYTLARKLDALGRTPVTLYSTSNDWSYQGPPQEKLIFVEPQTHDPKPLVVGGKELSSSLLYLWDHEDPSSVQDPPVVVHLSKYYGIPYQLTAGERRIVIKSLKKNF